MRMRREYQLGYLNEESDSFSSRSGGSFKHFNSAGMKRKKEKVPFHIGLQPGWPYRCLYYTCSTIPPFEDAFGIDANGSPTGLRTITNLSDGGTL